MRALALCALIGLAACTPMAKPGLSAGNGGCGDVRVARLVGQVWTDSLRAPTLKRSGAGTLRVIAPGMVVTMDYRPNRLNIETDEQGRITRITCG